MSVNLISYLRSLIPIIPEKVATKSETTNIQLSNTDATSWASIGSFVAPRAGIVRLNGRTTTLDNSCVQVACSDAGLVASSFPGWVNSSIHSSIYVGKGQTVNFIAQNMTQLVAYFNPTLGGANRLLSLVQAWIRGGLLCLLTSSILSARYLSCRALKHCRALMFTLCKKVSEMTAGTYQQFPLSTGGLKSFVILILRQKVLQKCVRYLLIPVVQMGFLQALFDKQYRVSEKLITVFQFVRGKQLSTLRVLVFNLCCAGTQPRVLTSNFAKEVCHG